MPLLGFNRVSSEEEMVSSRRKAWTVAWPQQSHGAVKPAGRSPVGGVVPLVLNETPKMARRDRADFQGGREGSSGMEPLATSR